MSLSIDNPYNAHLRQMIKELGDSPSDVANYPEMIYGGTRPQKMVTPESLAYANPLHDVLMAEKQLSVDYGMEGGSLLSDVKKGFKKTTKSIKKAGKAVEKGAKKVAKSKAVKTAGKVAKEVGKSVATVGLDAAEKLAAPAGAALGTAAATLTGNPELAPIAAAVGSKVAADLGKKARKAVKKKTGLGELGKKRPPSAWNLHVAQYRKDNGGSLKDAMKAAKATYKK